MGKTPALKQINPLKLKTVDLGVPALQQRRFDGRTGRFGGRKLMQMRKLIWTQAEGRCKHCGTLCDLNATEAGFIMDHVVRLADGGTNDIENLQVLCQLCNAKKGALEAALHGRPMYGRGRPGETVGKPSLRRELGHFPRHGLHTREELQALADSRASSTEAKPKRRREVD